LVASAGFGNGIAEAGSGGGGAGTGNGVVHPAGFADAQDQARASPSPKPQATPVPYEPVQITEKPDPVYTAEARQLRIQGEVLLRVLFTASSRVQVLGVERGLGHGLDEAATRAAEQIQFKPARRNGQPVDTAATVHILFQLAN
jgi:TonB family protein